MKFLRKLAIILFDLIDLYIHQKRILAYLKRKKIKVEIFFDVGSHKGTYSDLILRNFNVKKIIMFEPQTDIFNFLKKKYKNNKIIKKYNLAISNKKGFKEFNINKHDLTSSFTKYNNQNRYLKLKAKLFESTPNKMNYKKIKVKTIKLSEMFKKKKIKKLDLLKIDTEGHELEVLQGLAAEIKKVKNILIEFHPHKIYLNYKPRIIHEYLIKQNFELMTIYKFSFTTCEDRFYRNKNISVTNML